MNYSLGNANVPGKPKKVKRPTTPEEAGKESKKKRMARYNTPKDKEKVAMTMKINTQTKKAIDEERLQLNKEGLPLGEQKHKIFSLFKKKEKKNPRYRD